eukprot:2235229-Pyramimonas_sp.AAC.1
MGCSRTRVKEWRGNSWIPETHGSTGGEEIKKGCFFLVSVRWRSCSTHGSACGLRLPPRLRRAAGGPPDASA